MSPNLTVLLISCVAALLLTPVTSRLALLKGWVDAPGLRKVHKAPVAYLGGAAVMGALLVGLSTLFWLPSAEPFRESFDIRLFAIVMGAVLMFVVGIADDVNDIKATKKLFAQMLAASLVCASGVMITGIPLTETISIEFGIFSFLITILWIVGITNAINIIDGLDGLASGISVVACGAIAWTAFAQGHDATGIVVLALMGSILGFLPYNIHPARVFLGDAGSLTIGFLLASTSALTATKAPTLIGLSIPLVALGIPILDTLFAMVRRAVARRSMMSADQNHLHHRLMALGYGQPKTVGILCSVAALAVVASILAAPTSHLTRLGILAAAFVSYAIIFRVTGAIRWRESFSAVGTLARHVRVSSDESRVVDEAALQLEKATTSEEWWTAVTLAGEGLSFEHMALEVPIGDGRCDQLQWSAHTTGVPRLLRAEGDNAPGPTNAEDLMEFVIPCRMRAADATHPLRLSIARAESLEAAGRRAQALCRMIERHGMVGVEGAPKTPVSSKARLATVKPRRAVAN